MPSLLKQILNRELYDGGLIVWQTFSETSKTMHKYNLWFMSIAWLAGVLVTWYTDGTFPWLMTMQLSACWLVVCLGPFGLGAVILLARMEKRPDTQEGQVAPKTQEQPRSAVDSETP